MTLASRLMSLFPALAMGFIAGAALYLVQHPSFASAAWLLFTVYGFPVLAYRLHDLAAPLVEGVSFVDGTKYSPWWGSHQIQSLYIAFPALEAALRLIPGAYSAWLRLWGGRVGRAVYWTPGVELGDRGLLEIGDGVVFGHRVKLFSHAIKATKGDRLLLYARKIKIGAGAFIGADSGIGPGVDVEAGAVVPFRSSLFPNTRFAKEAAA